MRSALILNNSPQFLLRLQQHRNFFSLFFTESLLFIRNGGLCWKIVVGVILFLVLAAAVVVPAVVLTLPKSKKSPN
jgi:hypothetical protein